MSQNQKMVQKILLSLFACFIVCSEGLAQRARFEGTGIDDFFSLQSQPQPALPTPPQSLTFPTIPQPRAILTPPTFQQQPLPVFQSTPAPSLPSLPSFDPFSSGNQPFPVFPSAPQPTIQVPRAFQAPALPTAPAVQQPFGIGAAPRVQPFNYNFPQVPFQPQNRWPYQGTGTDWLPSIDFSWANRQLNRFRNDFLPRVLERPRVRQTWIPGDAGDNASIGNELSINDVEVATTATWPRFLGSSQPLRISPGFAAHFWNGPDTATTGVDIPARAYSLYLAFDHTTDPTRDFGLDNNATVGVYSDFDNLSSDSLRLTGRLVGWRRLNEYTVAKVGVEYLDRIRLKLLPVFGIYATPNPDIKIDLTFPRSKLSHRIPNFNNFEGWAYVGAEYGGGSWAIDREAGFEDQVDINDVRAFIGLEWIGPRRVTGFVDVGYVFARELVFRTDPINDVRIEDSILVRSGIAF